MSNSPLVQARILSPNHNGRRNQKITKIAIYHAAGVISGKWGNGEERKRRLTNAGYDYYAIQRRVNQLL